MRRTRLFLAQINTSVLCATALLCFATAGQAQEKINLKIKFDHGTQSRVTCDFSHIGSVIVAPEKEDDLKALPLEVNAKLKFFQRTMGDEQTIRYFERAQGKIKLDKGTTTPTLGDENRLVVARLQSTPGDLVEMASMTDVLEQAELELIQNPADPMTLAAVFNKTNVAVGDKWKPSPKALAKLLRVNEIEECDVQLLLKHADKDSARVFILGSLSAKVDDVTTEMNISGIALIDQKTNTLASLKLGIGESRALGQIAPGFEGKTKVFMQITGDDSPHLSNEALAKHTKNRKIQQRVKWQSTSGNFVVNYEPRWKMIAAEQEAAILRFIDRDTMLAQCNIVQLPSRPADKPLPLDTYKAEVAKIVAADNNARLISAASVTTPAGHKALRVVVGGEEEGVPVNWFYYHLSNKDGRQVTFVFTMARSVAKRVSKIATQMVNEFAFQPKTESVAAAGKNKASKGKAATTKNR